MRVFSISAVLTVLASVVSISANANDSKHEGCCTVESKAASVFSQLTMPESTNALSKCESTRDSRTCSALNVSNTKEDCCNAHVFQKYTESDASAMSKEATGCRPVEIDMSTTIEEPAVFGCSANPPTLLVDTFTTVDATGGYDVTTTSFTKFANELLNPKLKAYLDGISQRQVHNELYYSP